jgi:glycosyltransferase involved in cell wall biosynthesis
MPGKVCIITTVHQPFDTRIFHKEAKTLVQAGYDVILIAQHNKNEIVDGVKIIVLPKPRNRFMRIFGLTWQTLILALHQRADIYHFHDPELIFIGVLLRLLGKKVIYDVHEDVPKQILNKEWIGNVSIRKIAAFFMNIIEQIGVSLFNKIVAATPDIARRFPKTKTIILRNFPILELIDNAEPADYKKNKPIIIYAGGLTNVRGIKEIVQAMEYIDGKAELWLLGKWDSEKIKKECENLKGWKNTRYLGFTSLEEVFQYMKIADIGFCLLHPIKNYITGLPVKAFEYMACSLPMVISDFYYSQKIFGKCALFAKPYDPEDIADKIIYLLDKSDEAKKLGKRGRKLIKEKYSWEAESKKLIMLYNSFVK